METKIVYSCVVDRDYKFQYQGWLWANSLVINANVAPKNIWIHCTYGVDADFKKQCTDLGLNVVDVEPFGDKKYCNKLTQLFNPALSKADILVLMDTDTFILSNFEWVLDSNYVCGKAVDKPNPSVTVLKELFTLAGLEKTLRDMKATCDDKITYGANFNGGLYAIPTGFLNELRVSWPKWANWLLSHIKQENRVNFDDMFIDQMSFCMAAHENGFPTKELNLSFNFPLHILSKAENEPSVLHYHWKLNHVGLIKGIQDDILDNAVSKANDVIGKVFNNSIFWNYRYATSPELGSGSGSRGEDLKKKKELLMNLGIENYASVLDIGFGDLELMKDFELLNYQGVDISGEAIRIAQAKRPDWKFSYIDDFIRPKNEAYDYVQCLDVLIHQKTQDDFNKILTLAIEKTRKRLVISGFTDFAPQYESNHMLGFYGPLNEKLAESGKFNEIKCVLTVGCADIYVCDVITCEEQLMQ